MRTHSNLKMLATAMLLAGLAVIGRQAAAQDSQEEQDSVLWHNRYHALLAMSAYGDWNTLCPQQTFTREGLLSNFPNSTEDTWTVIERFGPTAHGAEGWTAYIPEMNKVTIIFKGSYNLEKQLPHETADVAPLGLGEACAGCRANAFALAGYMEAYQETNGFAKSLALWRTKTDCFVSITGHGLGGMHSIIATLHMGAENIITYSHNYGTPRTLNPAAAAFHNFHLGGNQLDRGAGNADVFMSAIPQSDEYIFTNTGVAYRGLDPVFHMTPTFCYEAPEDPNCLPQGDLNEVDHYFYFTNVGQCGGSHVQDRTIAEAFIAQQQALAGQVSLPNASVTSSVLGGSLAPLGVSSTAVSGQASSTVADGTTTSMTSAHSSAVLGSSTVTRGLGGAAAAGRTSATTGAQSSSAVDEKDASGAATMLHAGAGSVLVTLSVSAVLGLLASA